MKLTILFTEILKSFVDSYELVTTYLPNPQINCNQLLMIDF